MENKTPKKRKKKFLFQNLGFFERFRIPKQRRGGKDKVDQQKVDEKIK